MESLSNSPKSVSTSSSDNSSNQSGSGASLPLLPPCRICGEKASGFHYGANTCEACKGFFRRSLKRRKDYTCVADGNCVMNLGKRASCSHCRLKKCLAAGMSRTAIKTGRYTHEKKSNDIREVKQLELKLTTPPSSIKSSMESELDQLIAEIVHSHRVHTPHTPDFFATIPEKEAKFLEQEQLHQEMFGSMKPIPHDEYMRIYNSTGLDVDGRQELMQAMFNSIEESIRKFIVFIKILPNFRMLTLEDQIALVKAGKNDVWLIWHYPAFNLEKGLLTFPWGEVTWLEHTKNYAYNLDLHDLKLTCVRRLQNLNLTYEENILLGCVNFMASDKIELKDPQIVDDSQYKLVEALQLLLQRSHPESHQSVFSWCLGILTELRTVRELHEIEEQKFASDWEDKLKISPLIYEVWGS